MITSCTHPEGNRVHKLLEYLVQEHRAVKTPFCSDHPISLYDVSGFNINAAEAYCDNHEGNNYFIVRLFGEKRAIEVFTSFAKVFAENSELDV